MDSGPAHTLPTPCPGCADRDRRIAALEARLAEQQARIDTLERKLDESQRAGKRQAAPFSKGPPKPDPKKPGRKAGDGYGTKARRPLPPRFDETYEAPLPPRCPCGGCILLTHVDYQYQVEVPRTPVYRRFDVQVGTCRRCGRRVQGRHELQTSDALGCCASQLGPDAQAAAAYLNKHAGLSLGKVAHLFDALFGVTVTAGGVGQAIGRAARRCEPDYRAILDRVRTSPWAVCDETGWRVGGRPAWLHVAVAEEAIAYCVASSRGLEATEQLLGRRYEGDVVHDGWKPYFSLADCLHQLCNGHLLRRCVRLEEQARGGAVLFPRKVKALLKEGLAIRDARDAGRVTAAAAAAAADDLERRLEALVVPPKENAANETFARHLYDNLNAVFPYLRVPGLDATNWRAEQALRPAVVNRKVWGGNRTEAGAKAQGVLTSVLRTAYLHGRDFIQYLSHTLRDLPGRLPLLPPMVAVPVPSG